MKKFVFLVCAGLFSFGVSAADIDIGKTKAASCAACHGPEGIAAIPIYPNLAGQQAEYLEKQMKAFRDGERVDLVMSQMAKPLTDTDIKELAAYFASLK